MWAGTSEHIRSNHAELRSGSAEWFHLKRSIPPQVRLHLKSSLNIGDASSPDLPLHPYVKPGKNWWAKPCQNRNEWRQICKRIISLEYITVSVFSVDQTSLFLSVLIWLSHSYFNAPSPVMHFLSASCFYSSLSSCLHSSWSTASVSTLMRRPSLMVKHECVCVCVPATTAQATSDNQPPKGLNVLCVVACKEVVLFIRIMLASTILNTFFFLIWWAFFAHRRAVCRSFNDTEIPEIKTEKYI